MLCAYRRPRYQVSVYRTIGSLVTISKWSVRGSKLHGHVIMMSGAIGWLLLAKT